ncbi:SprT-like family protein [Flammeovirgaceae bacterium 311]|nr:SprT-like family protein [Flammeovirgaceae bacterium 311]
MLLFVSLTVTVLLLCLWANKGSSVLHKVEVVREDRNKAVSRDKKGLQDYVPAAAADYCVELWRKHNFTLYIKGNRKTKLGDFRVDRTGGKISISVNGTLNPYAFLITYLHEVAHLHTWQQYRSRVKPHGGEWQQQFQRLMLPMLSADVFPADILKPLKKYMQAPAAATASSQPLWIALRAHDEKTSENALFLSQIPDGYKFKFCQTVYQKVEVKRTRALCQNMENGRRYLISTAAQVELVA